MANRQSLPHAISQMCMCARVVSSQWDLVAKCQVGQPIAKVAPRVLCLLFKLNMVFIGEYEE